jgi:hypothetical protein
MNQQMSKSQIASRIATIRKDINARGYCQAYITTRGGEVKRMQVTEVTRVVITGYNHGEKRDETIARAAIAEIQILH